MKTVISKQDDPDAPQPQQDKSTMVTYTIVTTAIVFTTKCGDLVLITTAKYKVNKMTEDSERRNNIIYKGVYHDFRPDSYSKISSSVCHP